MGLLACFGIGIVEFREVNSAAEAVAAAEDLRYPVAAKATGEMWRRRVDLDGVRLDLTNAESVEIGYTDLATISKQRSCTCRRWLRRASGARSASATIPRLDR